DKDDSPLDLAAAAGSADMARLLIERGAAVNEQRPCCLAPLHAAASRGALDVVQLLLTHGADPNAMGSNHETPIFMAVDPRRRPKATQEREQILRLLIRAGAEVNRKSRDGNTPLTEAVELGEPGSVRILLEAGADVRATNRYGASPLRLAMTREKAALVLQFSGKVDPEDGSQLLLKCAEDDWSDVASLLLKRGTDPNGNKKDSSPALDTAISRGHLDIVRLLLSSGADPNRAYPTPLQRVLDQVDVVKIDPATRLEIVKLLISRRAKVSLFADRSTAYAYLEPLYLALFRVSPPDLKVAELLVAHGAQIDYPDGSSLVDTARQMKLPQVADFLLKARNRQAGPKANRK